jgi:hypothetical protein
MLLFMIGISIKIDTKDKNFLKFLKNKLVVYDKNPIEFI